MIYEVQNTAVHCMQAIWPSSYHNYKIRNKFHFCDVWGLGCFFQWLCKTALRLNICSYIGWIDKYCRCICICAHFPLKWPKCAIFWPSLAPPADPVKFFWSKMAFTGVPHKDHCSRLRFQITSDKLWHPRPFNTGKLSLSWLSSTSPKTTLLTKSSA